MGKTKMYLSLVTLASLSLYGENINEKEIDFSQPAIQLSSCKTQDFVCQKKVEEKIQNNDLYSIVKKENLNVTYIVNIDKNDIDSVAQSYVDKFPDLIIRRRVSTDKKKYANKAYNGDFSVSQNTVATVTLNGAVLYDFPNDNGVKIGKLKKSHKIILDGCNEYEWCKLQNQKKYIRKFRLNIDQNETIVPTVPMSLPIALVANETIIKPIITIEKQSEPIIKKEEQVILIPELKDTKITNTTVIENNETKAVENIETKEIIVAIEEEIKQPEPIVIIVPKTNENEGLVVKKEDVVVATKEMSKESKNDFELKKYFSNNFVGLGIALNSLNTTQNNEIGTITLPQNLDEQGNSFLFQVGTKFKKHYIISLNYEAIKLSDVKINSYFASVDYRFPYQFNPYLGVSIGVGELEWKTDPLVASVVKPGQIFSMLYGIQAGIEYPIIDNWNIFSQLSYQKLNFKTNLISTPAKGNITHDDKKSLGAGLRYSF